MTVSRIPVIADFSGTISLLREGYQFIANHRRRDGTDVFETRLMGSEVSCVGGPEAAQIFYDENRFERGSTMPARIKKTLVGSGGVQGLDGSAHERRKAMFMSLMTPGSIAALRDNATASWNTAIERWSGSESIVFFNEVPLVMFEAVRDWAGVPPGSLEPVSMTGDLVAMVDGFAAVGPRHWKARRARARCEQRVESVIRRLREGVAQAPKGSAAEVVATHRDANDRLLDARVAAVELLNILRPIVAIGWYITFAAHALHLHPVWQYKLRDADSDLRELFVQEVRRFYPFTPFVGARVRRDFAWRGEHFPAGRLVLLDVYGSNHDPDLWDNPELFEPARFSERDITPFDFIPQGGGDPHHGHRCAGEHITIDQTELAVSILSSAIDYDVPQQDLRIPLRPIPTHPNDGFVITNVQPRGSGPTVAG